MHEYFYKEPRHNNLKDTGCDLSPFCLSCHLPNCADDRHRGGQKVRMKLRTISMAKMRRAGHKIRKIAIAFGVSTRTVQRTLQRKKGGIGSLRRQ
jgi:hypothetical protein